MLCLGCVCGLIFARSRALGVLIITASAVLAMFGVIFLFVTSGTWEGSTPWGASACGAPRRRGGRSGGKRGFFVAKHSAVHGELR